MLSWQDALTFCTKATQVLRVAKLIGENEALRLPTEAEWEIACRVGSQTAYSFGDDPAQLGEYAWFHGNAAGNDPPAGAKKPNVWGFFDMHGYLWEWCLASDGKTPVARGGAWTSPAEECRSDSRKLFPAATKSPDLGFRCALGKR
jgi:formylglycine-generating enzyme required for sulfatase activity